jgi:hypothetical protein
MKTAYRYRLIFFPLEEYMILLLDGEVVYNGYIKMVGIPPDKKIKVLVKGTNGTVSKLLVRKSYFSFFNSENELFRVNDKKNYFNGIVVISLKLNQLAKKVDSNAKNQGKNGYLFP